MGLQLTLLGRFRAAVDGVVIDSGAWRRRKASALVKLLALQPGGRLHRDQVLDQLWPEAEPEAALNNLHQALHAARRALEPDRPGSRFLRWSGDVLELSPDEPIISDVAEFQACAAAARAHGDVEELAAAVARYSGDLLLEDLYEDWSVPSREMLRATYVELLRRYAERLLSSGDAPAAVEAAKQLVTAEPLDDSAQLFLVELLMSLGRRREALQHLDRFRETFRRELGVDLPPAAVALERRLLGGAAIAGEPLQAPPTRFIGRRREMEEVGALLRRARLVTIVGPGGGGKSRLAVEVLARAVADSSAAVGIVDLAVVDHSMHVSETIARDLGVDPRDDALGAVVRHYRERPAIVLLDNCEHVVDAVARVARHLMGACPRLRLLATSREPLGVSGETVWRIPPLALPTGPEDADADAVHLFLDRGPAACPRLRAILRKRCRDC
ncbi:MAG: hypothetical protein KatS3mg060_2795 [Dehalococcoidia bacterium]|nr:MAG: hypothetical protein KatS3mg060_2795 [Dehalococcoidia bacterium]